MLGLAPYPFNGQISDLRILTTGGETLLHLPKTAFASSAAELQQGLNGHTTGLTDHEGLFLFYPKIAKQADWMAHCSIPLDIAWFGNDGVLKEVTPLVPSNATVIWSTTSEISFGLETRPGLFTDHNIVAGNARVNLRDVLNMTIDAVHRVGACALGNTSKTWEPNPLFNMRALCARPGLIPLEMLEDLTFTQIHKQVVWKNYDPFYDSHPELGPSMKQKFQVKKQGGIEGFATVVTERIKKGEKVGVSVHVLGDPRTWTDDVTVGKHCYGDNDVCHVPPWFGLSINHCAGNHSTHKILEPSSNGWWAFWQIATRDLEPGEEINMDFNDVFRLAPKMGNLLEHEKDNWIQC